MLEVDAREHGERGLEHVGGVQASAEPDLHHGPLRASRAQGVERPGGEQVEPAGPGSGSALTLGRLARGEGRIDARGEQVVRDLLALQAHALGDALHVG